MRRNVAVAIALVLSGIIFTGYIISCGGGGGGDSGSPPTYPSSYANSKIIFVTHTMDSGNLKNWMPECSGMSTGLEAADCLCQLHAQRWGNLSGTYKAWLSDSTTSASARLSHSSQPYVNRRGQLIAANWTELTNVTLQCNDVMNYDESGEFMSTQFNMVWTGTDSSGDIATYQGVKRNCNDWTSNTSLGGYVGLSSSNPSCAGGGWTFWGMRSCIDPNRLYCVEQ